MVQTPARQLLARVGELAARGAAGAGPLPSPEQLSDRPAAERAATLDDLRVELYAVSSLIADSAVRRAYDARTAYPPYGLARSRFSEWRMLLARPEPYEAGSIDSYLALWQAYVDTTVFHLHAELGGPRGSGWPRERLEQLLALFKTNADAKTRGRMGDAFSFLYGGLQFGTSVSVQLVEAASRLLDERTTATADDKHAVIARSGETALRLATLNFAHALPTYAGWLSPEQSKGRPGEQTPGWLDVDQFAIQERDGQPWRVVARAGASIGEAAARDVEAPPYRTLGCPARVAPTGGRSAIALLWRWSVDVAHQTGLLAR